MPFEYCIGIQIVVWIANYHLNTGHLNTRQVKVRYSDMNTGLVELLWAGNWNNLDFGQLHTLLDGLVFCSFVSTFLNFNVIVFKVFFCKLIITNFTTSSLTLMNPFSCQKICHLTICVDNSFHPADPLTSKPSRYPKCSPTTTTATTSSTTTTLVISI